MTSVYGSGIGPRKVAPRPARVTDPLVRVMTVPDFRMFVHQPWEAYRAKIARASHPAGVPMLSPPAAPMYVTDVESLEGCGLPSSIMARLSLSQAQVDQAQLYGCVLIEFAQPTDSEFEPMAHHGGRTHGLTAGRAREWLLKTPVEMTDDMVIHQVLPDLSQGRYFRIVLA